MAEVGRLVFGWKGEEGSKFVMIANPHSVILCNQDEEMMAAAEAAALVLPDGVGIILAARILGLGRRVRVTGPCLMLHLCDLGRKHGLRHFFYGGAEGVADALARRLSECYPGLQVSGTYCPPFRPLDPEEETEVRTMLAESRPDVLWVGLGAPKQEKWIFGNLRHLHVPAIIGVGAAFDFHSGNVPWAPLWLRRAGLEWLHRLMMNPARMCRRNMDNFIFLAGVIRQRLSAPPER